MRILFSKIRSFFNLGGKVPVASSGLNTSVIKFPRDYRDTSEARYAINEHGYLEEILNDKLSNKSW